MAHGVHSSIKRVIVELEDGEGFVIPNANIERAEVITERESKDYMVGGDPEVYTIFREPTVRLLLVLVSDELSVYYNVQPEELPSGTTLAGRGTTLLEEGG